jgi:hypothetical protein
VPRTVLVLLHLTLCSCGPFAANNPVLGTRVAVPALQGDLMNEGCTGASVAGVVCVEVLPEAGVVPA